MNTLCINTKSKTEAIKLAKDHQLDFYNIAKQTILDSGYSYDVNVKIEILIFLRKNMVTFLFLPEIMML